MKIEITGTLSDGPQAHIQAIEAVTKSLCQATGKDPAEGVMMLLTAAAHLSSIHANKPASELLDGLAYSLGCATIASDEFFRIKPIASPAETHQ